jgi:hypothetical protein
MVNHKIRNIAITGITLVAVIALIALGAGGASAAPKAAAVAAAPAAAGARVMPDTTRPTCASDGSILPWACVQVFGAGLIVDAWNGWAHGAADGEYLGNDLHIELYYNAHGPAYPSQSIPEKNCGGFSLSPGENSPNCSWPGASPNKKVDPGYYCSAVWEHLGGNDYVDLDHVCVHVFA